MGQRILHHQKDGWNRWIPINNGIDHLLTAGNFTVRELETTMLFLVGKSSKNIYKWAIFHSCVSLYITYILFHDTLLSSSPFGATSEESSERDSCAWRETSFWGKRVTTERIQCEAPQLCLLVYKHHEYYSYLRIINHSWSYKPT